MLAVREAFSAVASAASPVTRSAHLMSSPLRFPLSAKVNPTDDIVSVYGCRPMDSSRLRLPSSFVVILASQLSAVHEHQEVSRPSPGPGRSTDDNRIVVRPIFSIERIDIAFIRQREASCHALADSIGGKHVQNLGKIRGHARGPG